MRNRISNPQSAMETLSTEDNESENEPKVRVRIGPPRLTRFERARIVGARALQLSLGAPPLIPIAKGLSSTIEIAIKELEARALPISIRRSLPNGEYQDIPISDLMD